MSARRFDEVIAEALDDLPARFVPYLENVAVLSRARPSDELLHSLGIPEGETIFGFYDGVPLTEQDGGGADLPGEILIFREPLLDEFGDDERELRRQIQITVLHEIGHHFGIPDGEMGRLE